MKSFKLFVFVSFILVSLKSNAQQLSFEQLKKLLNRPEISDGLLISYKFERTSVEWKYWGYLITEYKSPDKKCLLEISSTSQSIICSVLTTDSTYVKSLFKQGINNGKFIKDRAIVKDKGGNLGSLNSGSFNFKSSKKKMVYTR
ncbi:hypothetical protein [uncultured Mucilaginibacter sp.]|uniref:hypothetical protein n=1 Tax=uncultured Mucilaginibacter sp. TaxID=797541 RepID=UPI0025EC6A45|nr:hypothetical protein [uncultured Mucilaginibacter sp.]